MTPADDDPWYDLARAHRVRVQQLANRRAWHAERAMSLCTKGVHEMTPENTYMHGGHPRCVACRHSVRPPASERPEPRQHGELDERHEVAMREIIRNTALRARR